MVCKPVAGLLAALVLMVTAGVAGAQSNMAERVNQGTVGIVAGSLDGTSMRVASDLASVLDNGDALRILPIQGKGSVQAITDLLYLRGVDVGLIQRDALEYARREGLHADLDRRLQYIARLFNEEVHILARRDITALPDLQGQPVNIGVPGSGSDLTASLLFGALNIQVQPQELDHVLALQKLLDGEIAAMVYVGGKPTPLFQHLSGASSGVHLLPISYTPELLDVYLPARITHDDYAGLIPPGERIDTIAVEAIMAVYNWAPDNPRYRKVGAFVDAFFSKINALKEAPRHPKWQDVSLTEELPGWTRFAPARQWLERSVVADASPLRASFDRFLAQRNLSDVPEELKQSLFSDFVKWENSQVRTFALVPKAVNNPFFTLGHDGCKQAEAEIEGIECLYIGPGEHTEQEQAQILQDLIDRGIDGIAVAPTNSPLMASVLRRAKEAGLPVITWDADLTAEDRELRETYLGSNNYDIGVNIARIVQQLKPGGGSICLQTGGAAAANHNERLQGVRDTLAGANGTQPPGERLSGQNGWTEIEECPLVTDDDSEIATQQLAAVLARHADLDAFVSTGAFTQWVDANYREAIERYRSRLITKDLVMVMADTLPMQMDHLHDGLSHGQVGQRPYEMGYRAMFVLRDLADGKPVLEDPIYTGLDVCTEANQDTCLSGQANATTVNRAALQ
jgi:ribose transport system substrate-binding protein